jgi:CBS domain-containing protein
VATVTGQLLGYVLIGLGILSFLAGNLGGVWLAFIGLFLLSAAQQSYQQMVFRSILTGVPVGALARRDVLAVSPDLSVQGLVDDYLLRYSANVFPVVSEGRVLGTVGLNEVQKVPPDARAVTPVGQVMQPVGPDEVVPDTLDAWEAVRRLGTTECECLLLMDEDRLDGIVTRDSLLRWVHTQRQLRG